MQLKVSTWGDKGWSLTCEQFLPKMPSWDGFQSTHQHPHCHEGVCVVASMMGLATGKGGMVAMKAKITRKCPQPAGSSHKHSHLRLSYQIESCVAFSVRTIPKRSQQSSSLSSTAITMPHWQLWPHPVFLAHLFLLSSHCFAERGRLLPNRRGRLQPYSDNIGLQLSGSSLMPLCATGASRCHQCG